MKINLFSLKEVIFMVWTGSKSDWMLISVLRFLVSSGSDLCLKKFTFLDPAHQQNFHCYWLCSEKELMKIAKWGQKKVKCYSHILCGELVKNFRFWLFFDYFGKKVIKIKILQGNCKDLFIFGRSTNCMTNYRSDNIFNIKVNGGFAMLILCTSQ